MPADDSMACCVRHTASALDHSQHARPDCRAPCYLQAIAEINDKLKQGTWRPVSGKDVVVELAPAGDYWLAEDYHQQCVSSSCLLSPCCKSIA